MKTLLNHATTVFTAVTFVGSICTCAAAEKPRVVILTDISHAPDNQQSLVRFLTYSNLFDVEGIIATTSCWRKNDPDIAAIRRV